MPRATLIGMILCLAYACAGQSFDPPPTPELTASLPDTIGCDRAVVIKASSERAGVNAEYNWLDAYYPHHGQPSQGLHNEGSRAFDVLRFQRANGHAASVCFDITAFYGHY